MSVNKILVLVSLTLFTIAGSAFGAAYMKLGDIKGEATAQTEQTPATPQNVDSNTTEQPTGLLLPAIQNNRATDTAETKKKGNVETQWKVEKGEK
jgi:hypothetical protein